MALTTPIRRSQYAQKVSDNYDERVVFHFETDTHQVLVGDTKQTLQEFLLVLDGERTITLTGGVTGTVKTDGHSDAQIDVTVVDDSHEHTGATVKLDTADRVVVSSDDNSITVSEITTEELNTLSGVRDNVQKQLDEKVVASETNGNIILDGEELPVYVHPDIIDPEEIVQDPIDLDSHKQIMSVKNITVDKQGHVSALEMQPYTMPMISKFWVSTTEPNGQVVGDFWLETLNVEVEPNSFYLQPAGENANLADTVVVGPGTSGYFTLTDTATNTTTPAGPQEDYFLEES